MNDHSPIDDSAQRVRLRLEDYLLLDEAGAFEDGRRTELLEGDIYYMSPEHRPHGRITSRLYLAIAENVRSADSGLEAMFGPSVAIPPRNAPQPDITVTSAPEGDGLMPLAAVRLAVEVSDATLRRDMTLKRAIYARSGVPEYWIVDVNHRCIHQFWSPDGERYAGSHVVPADATIESATIPGLRVDTTGIGFAL